MRESEQGGYNCTHKPSDQGLLKNCFYDVVYGFAGFAVGFVCDYAEDAVAMLSPAYS